MTVRPEVLALIVACMLVTIIPRVLPLVLARRLRIPALAQEWLNHVPVAVIAALLVDQLLLVGETPGITLSLPHLIAGTGALAIATITRSIALTVVGGMGLFAGMKLLF